MMEETTQVGGGGAWHYIVEGLRMNSTRSTSTHHLHLRVIIAIHVTGFSQISLSLNTLLRIRIRIRIRIEMVCQTSGRLQGVQRGFTVFF